jgi:4-hydroxy-tetrahydrodipicolinate reductase
MTAVCRKVESIKVSRIQDASVRRIPFQQKIGAGLTLDEFETKKQTGTLRHVGLAESVQMIAGRMGWKLDRTEDILTPVVAEQEITTGYVPIKAGMAAGVRQIGKGIVGDREVITLEFVAAVGQANPADTVEITGDPPIKSVIPGGVNGDVATCAQLRPTVISTPSALLKRWDYSALRPILPISRRSLSQGGPLFRNSPWF